MKLLKFEFFTDGETKNDLTGWLEVDYRFSSVVLLM